MADRGEPGRHPNPCVQPADNKRRTTLRQITPGRQTPGGCCSDALTRLSGLVLPCWCLDKRTGNLVYYMRRVWVLCTRAPVRAGRRHVATRFADPSLCSVSACRSGKAPKPRSDGSKLFCVVPLSTYGPHVPTATKKGAPCSGYAFRFTSSFLTPRSAPRTNLPYGSPLATPLPERSRAAHTVKPHA